MGIFGKILLILQSIIGFVFPSLAPVSTPDLTPVVVESAMQSPDASGVIESMPVIQSVAPPASSSQATPAPIPTTAETVTSGINGLVGTSGGCVYPDVAIPISNSEGHHIRTIYTDKYGQFSVSLEPGTYVVGPFILSTLGVHESAVTVIVNRGFFSSLRVNFGCLATSTPTPSIPTPSYEQLHCPSVTQIRDNLGNVGHGISHVFNGNPPSTITLEIDVKDPQSRPILFWWGTNFPSADLNHSEKTNSNSITIDFTTPRVGPPDNQIYIHFQNDDDYNCAGEMYGSDGGAVATYRVYPSE